MEILKGFVFDIQRFAVGDDTVTIKDPTSSFAAGTLDLGAASDGDLLYNTADGTLSIGTADATHVKIGVVNTNAITSWTLSVASLSTVEVSFTNNSTKGILAATGVTFVADGVAFTAAGGATVKSTATGYNVDTGTVTVTKGAITLVTPNPVSLEAAAAESVTYKYTNDGTADSIAVTTSLGEMTYKTPATTAAVAATVTRAGAVSGMSLNEEVVFGATTVTAGTGTDGGVTFTKSGDTESVTAISGTNPVTVATTKTRTVLGDTLNGTATASTTSITGLTGAGAEFTTTSKKDITVATTATSAKVNGWAVTAGINTATVTTKPSATGGIQKVAQTSGTVDIVATLSANSELTAGTKEYVLARGSNSAQFTFAASDSKATAGNFYISSAATAKSLTGSGAANNGVTVNGDAYVTMATGQFSSVTDLGSGESVIVDTDGTTQFTLTANSTGVVTYTAGGVNTYFQIADGQTTTTMTSAIWDAASITAGIIKNASGNTILQKAAGTNTDIDVANCTQTTWFLADGTSFTKEPSEEYAAKVEVSGSGDSATRTLTITKNLNAGTTDVVINRVATTVKDTSTKNNTIYKVTNKDGVANINGAEFAVSAEGVISNSSSTITLLNAGTTQTLYLSGSVSVDTTAVSGTPPVAAAKVLTYVAGNGLTDTNVTLSSASPIVINESTNDTDTVIYRTGTIEGLDAGASVKNAFNGSSITTAGSDSSSNTYTINGVEWTVTGDANTTFNVNTANSTQLTSITSLDLDATVTTTKKFEQTTLTVNGTIFTNVVSKDGLTFTSTQKNTTASVELMLLARA